MDNSVLVTYLKLFGFKSLGELPSVFNPEHKPYWRTFLASHKSYSKNEVQRAVLAILDFVLYMRAQRLNPFISKEFNAKIKPISIKRSFITHEAQSVMTELNKVLRISGVKSYMVVQSKGVQLALDKKSINVNILYVPLKHKLDDVLLKYLKGQLYKTSSIPIQLKPSKESSRSVMSVLKTSSTWLPFTKVLGHKVYLKTTRDGLLVRLVILRDFDLVKTLSDIKFFQNAWKASN
jgi:hypothetical protein